MNEENNIELRSEEFQEILGSVPLDFAVGNLCFGCRRCYSLAGKHHSQISGYYPIVH
jgi:hypothetical protein